MQKIAVFIPARSFYGDTILLIPFFQNIREQFPLCKILVFSPAQTINILNQLNLFDEVIIYDKKKVGETFKPLVAFKPNVIFNFRSSSVPQNIICLLCRKAIKIGIRPSLIFAPIYHYKLKSNRRIYRALFFLKLLENPLFKPHFGLQKVKNLASIQNPFPNENNNLNICFMPGGGAGEYKRWGIQNFIALAILIKNKYPNAFFHFVVGSQEEADMKLLPEIFNSKNYLVYMNEKIPLLLQVVQRCVLTIANDCGPSHLAQMSGVNYIGVWGWVNQNPIEKIAEWTNQSNNSHHIIADQDQDIKTLKPEKVFAKADEILQNVIKN